MSQEYKIAQAFRSTVSKTDKTQKTWVSDYGKFWLWQAQVEEFPGQWFQLKKKDEASVVNPGDTIYGSFIQGSWPDGKPRLDFKSESKPFGIGSHTTADSDVLARLGKLEDAVFGASGLTGTIITPSKEKTPEVDFTNTSDIPGLDY